MKSGAKIAIKGVLQNKKASRQQEEIKSIIAMLKG